METGRYKRQCRVRKSYLEACCSSQVAVAPALGVRTHLSMVQSWAVGVQLLLSQIRNRKWQPGANRLQLLREELTSYSK